MKKFLLILKGIFKSIGNWFAEETLFYIRYFKSKRDKVSITRIHAIADELSYKNNNRKYFVLKDKELCKFIKHNWPESYSYNIVSPYITMCRKDYDYFAGHKVNGKPALKRLGFLDFEKISIYTTK